MVKHPTASAGDAGSIPGSGRSLGEGIGNPPHYSCWRIQWTEEPGGLQSMATQLSHTHTHTHITSCGQVLSKPGRHLPFQRHLPHHQVSPPTPFSSVLPLPPPLLGMPYPLCPLCPPSNLWSSLSKLYSSFEAQLLCFFLREVGLDLPILIQSLPPPCY